MTNARKRTIGYVAAVILLAAAATGILGWRNQIQRARASNPIAAQATSVGTQDVPIIIGPILR